MPDGHALVNESHFDLIRLRKQLAPFRLQWFPTLRSTNDHAARMRAAGRLFAPAIVLASRQTAGRGRGGNSWWSARGSLTVTFVLPIQPHVAPHQLPLTAGLAARNAAAELAGDDAVQLKWPNDLLHHGRKLAGLLCERVHNVDLVGLGLNVNLDPEDAPANLRDRITSLRAIRGQKLDMSDALIALSRHLGEALARGAQRPFADLLREYHAYHALVGRNVSIAQGDGEPVISGRVEGLDDIGRLLLRCRDGMRAVISGQVRMH